MKAAPAQALTRRRLLQLAAGASAAAVAGCAGRGGEPLRIAVPPWCGFQFMRLAAKEGWLPADVVLVDTPTAMATIELVEAHAADGAALTLDQALVVADRGVDLDIVLITDVSAGADALLVRPEIRSFADLRGKRIGAEPTSLGVVMTEKMLEAAGLQRTDVVIVPMTEDHLQSWNEQAMDGLLTYEPALGELEEQGLVRLFDSRSLPQTIVDVLAVRRDSARAHAGQLRQLVAAHFRALHLWRTNPIDTAYRLAPLMKMPVERVGRIFEGLDLPDEDYNRHYLAGPSDEMLHATADLAEVMMRAGQLRSHVEARQLFTVDYLPGPTR